MAADASRPDAPVAAGSPPAMRSRTPLAWGVLLCGVVLTLVAWRWTGRRVEREGRVVFERHVQLVVGALRERMQGYETVLRSAVGLFAGSESVERGEWAQFVAQMDLPARYPGILTLSAVERVPAAEVARLEMRVRAEGFPEYHVHPVGPRAEYFPVVYLEPLASNEAVLGFDVLSEPTRRVTAERTRDTGAPALSGRVALAQDAVTDAPPAIVMYCALYRNLPPAPTLEQRRAALRGLVTAAFRLNELMRGLVPLRTRGVNLAIYDGPAIADGALLYDEGLTGEGGIASRRQPHFHQQVAFLVGGHPWTLRFDSLPGFDASLDHAEPLAVLFGCLAMSVLLFGLMRMQGLARERALVAARQMTVQLGEREARLQAIVDNEPECVKLVSRDGVLLEMNPAGLAMVEATSADQVIGKPVLMLIHPDDRAAFQALHDRVLAGGRGSLSFRFIGVRGGVRWLDTSSVPLRNPKGRVTSVLSVTRDVTEQRNAEDLLRRTTAELEAVFRAVPDLFFRVHADGTILDYRGGSEGDLYLPPAQFLGRKMGAVLPSPVAEQVTEAIARVWETGLARTLEYTLPTAQGEGVFEARILPLTREQLVVVARNITERKHAEEARTRLEARLRQGHKLEAMGTLAGGIAHDFNNILGCILGFGELARADCVDTPRARENVDNILLAGQRAKELVEQIVAFSRQQEPERRPLDLGVVVNGAIRIVRAAVPASIDIRVAVPPGLPLVLADTTQIHRLLINLATNAAQAMDGGEGLLEIDLTPAPVGPDTELPPGPSVRLSVRDTGRGMDEATVERIFEPFFTTKGPGRGTGLGLSVVHGIVQEHHGSIVVRSEPGLGTTFEVYFPVYEGAAPEDAAEPANAPRGHGERILLVDDEALLAEAGRRMLESLGYRVTALTNPVEALAVFRTRPGVFDLAVVDLTMPALGGIELARDLFAIRSGLPVLLNTGFGGRVTPEAARGLGFRGLLVKPLTLAVLGRAVHEALASEMADDPAATG